jgi:uncharacterized repeat protein (TIGR03803 family)
LLWALVAVAVSASSAAQYLVLHSLALDEGNSPRSTLVQDAAGNLYGTAVFGGENGSGSVFKLEPDGDNFVVLHHFDQTDGDDPEAGVILGAGFLFGTASDGGNDSSGVVYKVDTNGDNFAVIHHFDGASDGANPFGGLVQGPDTILYGVTRNEGPNGFGTVFRVDPGGQEFAVLHTFGSVPTDGSNPHGGLLLASDGKLYGTTENAHNGSGFGTVFRINTDGSDFETLHTFTGGNDGQEPLAPLYETPDGFLYGTTVFGGSANQGTVFKLRRDGTDYQIVHAFSNDEGTDPRSPLIRIEGGLLYGTASAGGANGGTVYRMTLLGQLVDSAHDFTDASGDVPQGGVLQGLDGALYGTASSGGANNVGVIWKLTTPSVISITPDSGPAAGGTEVTIGGTGFQNQATVALSGSMATNVDRQDANTITATTPNLAPGLLHDLAVVNPDDTIGFLERAWLADFLDVPGADSFHDFVEAIVRAGITAGCGGGNYCRNNPVTRGQMAVFILKAKHGQFYLPPDCTQVFDDVPCPGHQFADWIEQLAAEGITSGCGGPNYCPNNAVTRAQMSAFLLKGKFGSSHVPPTCTQVFDDVACPGHPFADWIGELVALNITAGCQAPPAPPLYCPGNPNTRGQMAVFLTKTFLLP